MPSPRQVYMVLSPRALGYARDALDSLFRNCAEEIHLRLITDSGQDAEELRQALARLEAGHHRWTVYTERDLTEREDALFGNRRHLRAFRGGHPCWRKITDPLLLSDPGAELVLLDPDLYFPNRFRFESTPSTGLLLMWQRPNCLYPPEVVHTAMGRGIRLAHHVDIGVAHWRASADLDWLDWLLARLGGERLPRLMHVEAIVWSALAMRCGGGYLDPSLWRCWRRSPARRVMAKMGMPGVRILRSEPWAEMKCFHAGGEAKWWLHEAREQGLLDSGADQTGFGSTLPFVELTPAHYSRERALKRMLQALGYYQAFRPA